MSDFQGNIYVCDNMILQFHREVRKSSGFTLIELLTVVAVIGVLAAIAGPGLLKALPNIRLKAAARDMYGNMQQARIGAVKTHQDWAIIFDPANEQYTIYSGKGDDEDWGDNDDFIVETVDLSGYKSGIKYGYATLTGTTASVSGGTIPTDNVSYAANRVVFNPLGTGSAGYVYLDNQDGTVFAVGTRSSGSLRVVRSGGTGGGWQ